MTLLGDFGSCFLQILAYEDITIARPPRSTTAVSAALVLVYVNGTTWPHDINHYCKILDELLSFDWVTRVLRMCPCFCLLWGIHVLFWWDSSSQRGTFLKGCFVSFVILRITFFLEKRSIANLFFLFDGTLPHFLLRQVYHGRGRSLLLVRGWSSKTSPQPLRTMILGENVPALFHYALNFRDS
ncbi:hypothetical protein AMTRI_Chr11g97500 [Amborella trichopoda]